MIRVPEHTTVSTATKDVCPMCKGRGYILYHVDARDLLDVYGGQDLANDSVKDCPKCKGKREETDLTKIPDMYAECDIFKFDFKAYSVDISKYKEIVFNFFDNYKEWKNKGKGLYLWSKEPGSGKTFLACCLARSTMMKHNIPRMRFVTVIDYIDKVGESYDIKKNGGFLDPSKVFRECDLLILDDIGAQVSKEWQQQEIFKLVNQRIQDGNITIFTSNMPVEKLNVDERAKSRIMSSTIQLHMPEESIRQKKSDEGNNDFLNKILKGEQ